MAERLFTVEHRIGGIVRLGRVEENLERIEDELRLLAVAITEIRFELAKKPTTEALSYMIPIALWVWLAISVLVYLIADYSGRVAVL
jgi:hypothetical protein